MKRMLADIGDLAIFTFASLGALEIVGFLGIGPF